MKKITITLLLMATAVTYSMDQEFFSDKQEITFPSPLQIPHAPCQDFSHGKSEPWNHTIETTQEDFTLGKKQNNSCRRLAASYLIMGTAVITTMISADVALTYFNK